jgi:L-alanine-DL-glutamate epimerase-like enolase superfamily enzyme
MKINRIALCPIEGRFHKFVSMNAGGAGHGSKPAGLTYTNVLIRIGTDQGVEGLGVMAGQPDGAYKEAVRSLIGANPLELYEMSGGLVGDRLPPHAAVLTKYPHLDGALLDLIGKLNSKPCWKLLGNEVRPLVPAYDGTIYFADIWFRGRGVRAVLEEVEESLKKGYTGMKLKVGRSLEWMEKDAGVLRDLEVLRETRKIAGPLVTIMADDNNAFADDFARAWRFMEQTRDINLHWIEEIFPETVRDYSRLKDLMAKSGMNTLIADGENFRDPDEFEPYLKPRRLMDVLQLDIRNGGILKCREVGRMAKLAGGEAKPHNWASQIGVLMALHLAKACPGVTGVEDDRSTCDALTTDGYSFRNGFYKVPDTPGLSLSGDEKIYKQKYQAKETVLV